MDLHDKTRLYRAKFGHTFNIVALNLDDPRTATMLENLLDAAIAGKRGAITDADVGISVPKDALI